jgi:acetoin utilization protein AcuB
MSLFDIMNPRVFKVTPDDTVERVKELFEEHSFHHVVVIDHGRLVGIVSDRDLLKNISPFIGKEWAERPQDVNTLKRRVHQIMSRGVITAVETAHPCDAAALMVEHDISCVPVVDADGKLKGIVTWKDILRSICALDIGRDEGGKESRRDNLAA